MTIQSLPKSSIALPVYNGARYLEQAIRSVLEQDFENFELIISDNASTDATPEICRRFCEADPRITYMRHPRNIGAAKNYNYAFHLARGVYFNWLAHDDILGKEFLSACLKGFDRCDNSTVLVYPRFEYIDEDSRVIATEVLRCVETVAETPGRRMFETLERLATVTSIFGLFRREALARTRLIGSYVASDYVLLAECALLGKIVRLDSEPLFMRRLHAEGSQRANKTADQVAKWFDPEAVADARPARRVSREYLNSICITPGLSLSDRLSALFYLNVQRILIRARARRLRRLKRLRSNA